MYTIQKFTTPQIKTLHSGKVRDSLKIDDERRLIVVTDRISAFDKVLKTPIPCKGAVLNKISNFWFNKTKHIINNHFIKEVDPNITLVRTAVPLKVEIIVRQYLTGSMWRGYKKGKRTFSGVTVGDGLTQNDKFPTPIITPTTKDESDEEITPELIVKNGLVDEETYKQIEDIAIKLFELGTKLLEEKGIILVDTKYEFGLIDGKLHLIDEIHTPDSSRFWYKKDYDANKENVTQIDKEYTRQWLLSQEKDGIKPDSLPEDVIKETSRRYVEIYEAITGEKLNISDKENIKLRMYKNLVENDFIKDGYVAIVMGSMSDLPHCEKIKTIVEKYDIKVYLRVISAHKNGEEIPKLADVYNNSIEPGCVIAVAGRSNGLGGALAANLSVPVINCPPFGDKDDMMVNVYSSLMMPSKTPATTSVQADNAAYAALRSLNIHRLKDTFNSEIQAVKKSLKEADEKVREL